jgi:hypothetical protein
MTSRRSPESTDRDRVAASSVDEEALLDELASWLHREPGARSFTDPDAIHAYEQLGNHIYVCLREHRVASVGDARAWLGRIGRAVKSDLAAGAPAPPGHAMLAFLANVSFFLDQGGPTASPSAGKAEPHGR